MDASDRSKLEVIALRLWLEHLHNASVDVGPSTQSVLTLMATKDSFSRPHSLVPNGLATSSTSFETNTASDYSGKVKWTSQWLGRVVDELLKGNVRVVHSLLKDMDLPAIHECILQRSDDAKIL